MLFKVDFSLKDPILGPKMASKSMLDVLKSFSILAPKASTSKPNRQTTARVGRERLVSIGVKAEEKKRRAPKET